MITVDALYVVLVVLGGLLLAAIGITFAHAGWLTWNERFDPPRLARARAVLGSELTGLATATATGTDTDSVRLRPELTALPHRLRRRLLTDVAQTVHGDQRQRLAGYAGKLGILTEARRWTRSRWWWRRLRGVHVLMVLGIADPGRYRLLHDHHPAVRAEAATWAGDHLDGVLADRLVRMLADGSLLCRHAARESLRRAGAVAIPAITARLARDGGEGQGEVQAALLDVAAERPDPGYGVAARRLAEADQPAVRAAAAGLLGALAGDDAVAALERRLIDPDAAVRQSAATAIGRLGHWPAAPAVAHLLRDRAWDVRRAAGEALTQLGPPGALMLQRYRRDPDPFAADMAERVAQTALLRSAGSRDSVSGRGDQRVIG